MRKGDDMKKKVTSLELAKAYLKSAGVSTKTVERGLQGARFELPVYRAQLKKSNIVSKNKRGLGSHETHIHIMKRCWGLFFSPDDILDYEASEDTHESIQRLVFFEANLCKMLERRAASHSSLLDEASPSRTYSVSDQTILGTGCKWIDSNDGATQLRLSKSKIDSASFADFRLGIQVDDTLIMMKDKYTGDIFAISIPAEFVSKFDVVSMPAVVRIDKKKMEAELSEDDIYVRAIDDSAEIVVPPAPQPPTKKTSSPKGPVYKAKAGVGKRALRDAGYICECDDSHNTFTARSTAQQYMEPHHLIPISKQGLFEHGLDVPANIICLCPTCHSRIHYGMKADVKNMVKELFEKRSTALTAYGIEISESELFALYEL